jgi:hypothetical protein
VQGGKPCHAVKSADLSGIEQIWRHSVSLPRVGEVRMIFTPQRHYIEPHFVPDSG